MSSNLQAIKQRFGIIGTSRLLDAALDTAVRVASTDLTVLIQGESGVGKEVFSKVIHALSARKHNSFIAINCGAIPEGTINSELFGHEKGAFTGATNDRKGYFETVNGGTIFLDEIGEMPLDTQAFLLRVLENGEYVRVGSSKVEKTDVRVVAATNVQLEDAVRKGKFREDLYYRLNTVPIRVPALKERTEDIYLLFRKFVADFAEKYRTQNIQLDDRAQLVIERYTWPGNIRELKNVAEQLCILSDDRFVTGEILLEKMPHLLNRPLPIAARTEGGGSFEERDIMYKFLYDMKNDLSQLKGLLAEIIKRNNLDVPNTVTFNSLQLPSPSFSEAVRSQQVAADYNSGHDLRYRDADFSENTDQEQPIAKPIIIQQNPSGRFDTHVELVDEPLSLADMEKRQIERALKKYAGRRKEAADELGISERTLYRKIKEYELD